MEVGYTTILWDYEVGERRLGRALHKLADCPRIQGDRISSISYRSVDGEYYTYQPSFVNEEWRRLDKCKTCESRSTAERPDFESGACFGSGEDFTTSPKRGKGAHQHWARLKNDYCNKCSIKEECLEYALVAGITEGLWGGLTDRERGAVRSERGLY